MPPPYCTLPPFRRTRIVLQFVSFACEVPETAVALSGVAGGVGGVDASVYRPPLVTAEAMPRPGGVALGAAVSEVA